MQLVLTLLMGAAAAAVAAGSSGASATTTTTLVAASAKDLVLSGGAEVTANPLANVRSGEPKENTTASFAIPLQQGVNITGISFGYRYMTGFGPAGVGTNFSLVVAGRTVYSSPHLTDYTYSKAHPTNYSSTKIFSINTLNNLRVASAHHQISIIFANNDRNLQLLLPLRVNVSCTGSTGGSCAAYPLLPTAIASNMVLQRAPARPNIWGNNVHPGETVTVQLTPAAAAAAGAAGAASSWSTTAAQNGSWSIAMDPQPVSTGAAIEVRTSSGRSQVITNIAFGDVYLCSGQSNMEFSTNRAFNASAEIAAAGMYPNIRMFTVAHAVANSPQPDVADKTGGTGVYLNSSWAVSSPAAFAPVSSQGFNWFSAVCYFFGRDVYTSLNGTVPIGLVASDWGGQEIQVFMSPEALNDTTCGGTVTVPPSAEELNATTMSASTTATTNQPLAADVQGDGVTASQLWYAMLSPLARMRFAGAVWYQGEDNCWAPHQYSCLFPAMIADWRAKFDLPDMSFFFVQLAPYWPRRDFTAVRNAQMAALKLPKTGYAVAIDLGDAHSPDTPIHPRRKQEVGRRLALTALNVQYGQKNLIHTGPAFDAISPAAAVHAATVSFSAGTANGLHAHGTADCDQVGSRLCCRESPFEILLSNGTWGRANYTVGTGQVEVALPPTAATPISARYAWEAWPQCSLYNGVGGPDDHTGIAGTPFCWNGTIAAPCAY